MGLLLLLLGRLLLGPGAAWMVGAMGVVALLFGPRVSPAVVMRLYRARPLTPWELPEVQEVVAELAARAGLQSVPRLYYVPTHVLNAFSVGDRGHAAIGLTDGVLRRLAPRELVAVLAHETAHVAHDDVRVMSLADLISRITSTLSTLGQAMLLLSLFLAMGSVAVPWTTLLLLVFGPMLMGLLQLALSRTREFSADLGAVRITGDPVGLASALRKLERSERGLLESILMPGRRNPEPSLLRTHPATEARVERLLELAGREPERAQLRSRERGYSMPSHFMPLRERPRYGLFGLWY
jgi:heat shock protein HtpX